MSVVSIVKVESERVEEAVRRAIELGGDFIPPGATVLVKPNVVSASPSGSGHVTDARVTEAVRDETKTLAAIARAVKEQGGMLWVDLPRKAALAFCMTLPVSSTPARSVPA